MATTRNPPSDPTEDAPSGFTDEQRAELRELMAELIGSSKAPPAPPPPSKAPPVSDSDWDKMTDRSRESWVRSVVDEILDGLARDDQLARQQREIDALKEKDSKPEPERPPGAISKLQAWIWGREPEKA